MRIYSILLLLFISACTDAPDPVTAPALNNSTNPTVLMQEEQAHFWTELAPGLLFAQTHISTATPKVQDLAQTFTQQNNQNASLPPILPTATQGNMPLTLILLRINPNHYEFSLHMASEEGRSYTLPQWAEKFDLAAVINAGMFLPDKQTATGYLRNAQHTNNPRVVTNFGSFFVAEPLPSGERIPLPDKHTKNSSAQASTLPLAALLDRDHDDWKSLLPHYKIVIQNYRLINRNGELLWPDNGPGHSSAAIGQDVNGYILFIFCPTPVSVATLAKTLQGLPLEISSIMYAEGASPAGLLIRTPQLAQSWKGFHPAALLTTPPDTPIPNILGIRPRNRQSP